MGAEFVLWESITRREGWDLMAGGGGPQKSPASAQLITVTATARGFQPANTIELTCSERPPTSGAPGPEM